MQFRIGMHSGEVVVDSDRIYGSGINIAARLERLARPGGICISDDVREQLDATPELEDIGPQYVKNIPYPIHAFFVDVPGQAVPERVAMSRRGRRSRFCRSRPPSGDSDAEYLADGMTEDLITTLAMWRQFPVIARNSTFLYKGRTIWPGRGQGAGAEYLVVGSLRRGGDRVRIAAAAARAETGRPLWADRWNTDARGRVRDRRRDRAGDLGRSAARTAQGRVRTGHAPSARRHDRLGLRAARAVAHPPAGSREDGEQAVALLTRAVELDPDVRLRPCAPRPRPLSDSSSSNGRRIALRLSLLCRAAERAIACDPMEAYGYVFRALGVFGAGQAAEGAITALRRAVELNPSLPVARSLLGQFLGIAGETEEGLRELDHAILLSPRDPQLWSFHAGKAGVLFMAGRDAEARS